MTGTRSAPAATNRIPFNKTSLDAIPFASPGKQVTYYDTGKTNLALRVGATTKTFIVYTRPKHGGAPVRITLGKYGDITVKHAADLAAKELAKIADGLNPNEEKKKQRAAKQQERAHTEQTLGWLLDLYEREQIVSHKGGAASTRHDLKTTRSYFGARKVTTLKQGDDGAWVNDMEVMLSDWLSRPFREISRQDVLDRFDVLSRARPTRTPRVLKPVGRTHQLTFKYSCSAVNFLIARDELDVTENYRNPFDVLSSRNRWEKTNVRTRLVEFRRPKEFREWWKAVEGYTFHEGLVSDYMLFSLVQAARSIDAAPLKWPDVEMDLRRIHYRDTKNGETYTLPMTKLTYAILRRRLKKNADGGVYVFDYDDSKTGHVTQDCQHHFEQVAAASGTLVSHHDLRRTWATAAWHLKLDVRNINYCLKHKASDVNEHYFVRHEQELRELMQTVEDFFLRIARGTNASVGKAVNRGTHTSIPVVA